MAGQKPIPAQPKAQPPSLTAPPPPTQSTKPAASPEPGATRSLPPLPPAPPVKVPLEDTVKNAVALRRDVLVGDLRKETEVEVQREEDVRKGKERITDLQRQIDEIDAFLARS